MAWLSSVELTDRLNKFQAHAVADGSGDAEAPMDIMVKVIDQNDNKPTSTQDTFLDAEAAGKIVADPFHPGHKLFERLPSAEVESFEVIKVDQPYTDNSDIRYRLMSQEPQLPRDFMFVIKPVTGVIRVNAGGLDRETQADWSKVVT
ncbi:cadherin-3-like [Sander vitreus]